HVLSYMRRNELLACHLQSFPTTIVIKQVSKCLLLKLSMEDGVELRSIIPNLVKDAEDQVRIIRENLRVAQSRQKTYADHRRRELHLKVGDYVYLKVSPFKGTRRFH